MEIPKCPVCKEDMETGFMLDRTHGANLQGEWVSGIPKKSFWTGIRLKGLSIYPVSAYRCRSCGLLQSYAHRPRVSRT